MKTRRLITLLTVVVLTMSMLAPAALADTIKIGGIGPLTGPVALYGQMVKNGVDLYVKEINAKGGVLGQQIEMVWMDDTHDAVEAANAYAQLSSGGVKAIIGPVTTTPTLAVTPRAAEENMPLITASATAYDVTSAGKNIFRTCFLDPYQAQVMARFAAETLQAKKVAVLFDNTNDYSIGLSEAFQAKAKELGVEVVAVVSATEGGADYTPELGKIAEAAPDAVFVGYYYETAALVLRQAVDVGLEATMMGPDGWSDIAGQLKDAPELLEKAVFCDSFSPADESETVKNFVAAYTAEYGAAPAGFNALGYDTAHILFAAIEKAGSFDERDAITAAMKATDDTFVTGHIVYDDHNDPIKTAFVMGFKDGVQTLVTRVDP